MNKLYFYSFIIILIILQGCTFEPKGEEFVKLDPTGKPSDIEINLNLAVDTIFIQQSQYLIFAYAPNGNHVIWAKFTVNGQETEVQKDQAGNIRIAWDFKAVPGGIYPLELKIFARSQTGSIADKMDAEGSLISRKWIMVVKEYAQMGSKITKFEFVDGSLNLQWSKFIGKTFKNYKVYKSVVSGSAEIKLLATINSREQTSVVDNTFHGENSQYYILTNDDIKGETYYSPSGPFPAITVTNTANGNILLTWNKPSFYKNIKGYRLTYVDEFGVIQNLADLNSTDLNSFTLTNPMFGFSYSFYLTMVPLTDNYYDELYSRVFLSSSVDFTYGTTSPGFGFAKGGTAPISYFLDIYSQEGILVFDHQKFSTVRKLKYVDKVTQFDVSANNKYLVGVPNLVKRVYFENLIDPTKSKMINLSVSFPLMTYMASVSDAGTGVFLNDRNAVLYDYINETKLAEITLSYVGLNSTRISSSGNFFYCETYFGFEYFQYKNNQIIRLQKADYQSGDKLLAVDYLPGNNEKLIRAFPNRVEVVDCNTWTIENQWLFPDLISEAHNLDKRSGKLLIHVKNKLLLLDVMSGTKEEIATTMNRSSLESYNMFYNNGITFWARGKALK